jgi:hypothetical protein
MWPRVSLVSKRYMLRISSNFSDLLARSPTQCIRIQPLAIASNPERLGNVRHLSIRFNLVRCYVSLGEITMAYCVTEEMVADLLTKIVSGSQDTRLTIRFYNLCPSAWDYVVDK